MADLDPIDRWYSEPLDVHVWSHHPEIRELTDCLFDELGISRLESKSNNKSKISPKSMLRVLLLDLYVRWLKDPNLATCQRRTKTAPVAGALVRHLIGSGRSKTAPLLGFRFVHSPAQRNAP